MKSKFNAYLKPRIPLILQITALHSYLGILLFKLDGDRFIPYYLILCAFAFGLDFFLNFIFNRKFHLNLSVWIVALATFMLVTTQQVFFPYCFSIFVAIAAKYIFRTPSGHIFNPANIGILTTLCLFPELSGVAMGQWLGGLDMLWIFVLIGFFVSFVAGRIAVSTVYISCFFLFRLAKFYATGLNFSFLVGPILSVGGFIFAFHMISDPRTSPKSILGQILFAFLIAVMDFVFREMQIPFAALLALSLICAVRGLADYAPVTSRFYHLLRTNPVTS